MVEYARERFGLKLFGPLGLGLAAVALLPAGAGWSGLAAGWLGALVLLFALRLADDLLDREIDRRRGLARVAVKAASIRPLLAALAGTAALALGGLYMTRGLWASAGFAGLLAALSAAARTGWLRQRPLFYAGVPTLKYPTVVALLAGPEQPRTATLLLVYAAAVAWELYHDADCRQALKGTP